MTPRSVIEQQIRVVASEDSQAGLVTLEEARGKRPRYAPESFPATEQFGEDNLSARHMDLGDIVQDVDWSRFLAWQGIEGKFPEIIYRDDRAESLYEEAMEVLGSAIAMGEMDISAEVRFYDACSETDDLILDGRFRIPLLRQQSHDQAGCYLSLADFVPDKGNGYSSVGLFAISARWLDSGKEEMKDQKLRKNIARSVAEAVKKWMVGEVSGGLNVIAPEFGSATLPDASLAREAMAIMEITGFSADPASESLIVGLLISHPQATCPVIDVIGTDQLENYTTRREAIRL